MLVISHYLFIPIECKHSIVLFPQTTFWLVLKINGNCCYCVYKFVKKNFSFTSSASGLWYWAGRLSVLSKLEHQRDGTAEAVAWCERRSAAGQRWAFNGERGSRSRGRYWSGRKRNLRGSGGGIMLQCSVNGVCRPCLQSLRGRTGKISSVVSHRLTGMEAEGTTVNTMFFFVYLCCHMHV